MLTYKPAHPYETLIDYCLEQELDFETLPAVLDVPGYLYAAEHGFAIPHGMWQGSDEVLDALASICASRQFWANRYAQYLSAHANGLAIAIRPI